MAQPTPYERQFAFSGQPKATWAEGLENELNAVKVTSDETLDNLELIQRDDGKLRNGIVTRDSLAPDLALAGLVALDFADEATSIAGEADNVAMAPLGVKQQIDARLADQPTMEAGEDNVDLATSLGVKQQIDARLASQPEAEAGSNNTKTMTPLRVKQAVSSYAVLQQPGDYIGVATEIVSNFNPSNFTDWANSRIGENYEGFGVVVGDYGARQFGTTNAPAAISGAIKAPASAVGGDAPFHVDGVAGWASTEAPNGTGAVGVYGQADALVAAGHVWGFNTRTQDNGFASSGLWGGEIDINVDNAASFVRGLDIVGGSSVQFSVASPAIIIQTPGLLAGEEVRWGRGIFLADGSCITGIEIGAAHSSDNHPGVVNSANSGSMPIEFYYRNGADARVRAGLIDVRPDGAFRFAATYAAQLVKFQGRDGSAALTENITLYAGNTGIGNLPGLPGNPLEVKGQSLLRGVMTVAPEASSANQSGLLKIAYRDGANAQQDGLNLIADPSGNVLMQMQPNTTLWKFQGKTGGSNTDNITIYAGNTGIGSGLPSYPLDVNGAARFQGNIGFFNTIPIAKPTGVAVTAAGIHAALVSLGLISA